MGKVKEVYLAMQEAEAVQNQDLDDAYQHQQFLNQQSRPEEPTEQLSPKSTPTWKQ